MNLIEEILHVLLDVLSGRRNLPPHAADELHDKITPGYTAALKPLPSAEQLAAAQAILAQGRPLPASEPPYAQAMRADVTTPDEPDPRDAELARLRGLLAEKDAGHGASDS